jgi:formylglycine-generating enzyme required for sulfatase activity
MAAITGGTVTTEPQWENHGFPGASERAGEPGPFYDGGTFPTKLPATVANFKIGKYDVTRELWQEVSTYTGYGGITFSPPDEAHKFFPQTNVNLQQIIVWCNAYSEKSGKTPVYYKGELDGGGNSVPIEPRVVIRLPGDCGSGGSDRYGGQITDTVYIDPAANGFRVPTNAEWEYAARGGVIGGTGWNYRWPGTNVTAGEINDETLDYMWVDPFRFYDTANMDIPVGILKPNYGGLYDMAGNIFDWTPERDSVRDQPFFIHKGGAFYRDEYRSAFDSVYYQESKDVTITRDVLGFRVVSKW